MARTMSTWNCGTSAHRRSPSGWSSINTSAMPRTFAASLSSRALTAPRSPSARSAGSLTDPLSPCDAHNRTTRAPASARRAIVPPQASDSSSGWASTTRMVRPAMSGAPAGDNALIHCDVFVDHALDAEARHGALADAAAIEREDGCQIRGHRVERLEDHSRHAFVNDLSDGAEVERNDGRAARHRLGQHEAERLARLHRIQ